MIANDDTIETYPELPGVEVIRVKGNSLAAELENPKVLNMVILGALLKKRPVVDREHVVCAMEDIWG